MIEHIQYPPPDKGEEAKVGVAKSGPGLGHLEQKTDGQTEAHFTARPAGDLPLDVTPSKVAGEPRALDSSTTDVAVLPDEPSVWDANPGDI